MADKDQVTVVIPTLNEKEAIGPVLDEVKREGYRHILVVDGYSSDDTVEIARSKGAKVVFQHGLGKTGAIKTAIDLVETPYMAVMDGDHTYDPRDIERLLQHADKHDLVIGARVNRENIPLLHRFGNKVITSTFNLLMGSKLSDVCSGMYLLKTEMAKKLDLTSRGFDIEVEIVAQCYGNGRVTEVPISYRKRLGKKKLQTWRAGLRILTSVIGLARAYNPVFLLSTLAALFTIPGVALLLWELTMRWLYGAQYWSEGKVWLGLFLLVVGLQGFTLATISLLIRRLEKRILTTVKQ
jgi:dolichol-phosphate mannosyltransferase